MWKEYLIPFVGLKDGEHDYRFQINHSFFDHFPYSEIKDGNVSADVLMIKRPNMLTFEIRLNGKIELPCDRCGNNYSQELKENFKLVVNTEGETFNDEDDLVTLSSGTYEFDLSTYLYQYISLLIPSRRVCGEIPDPKKGCDPEVIKKLEKISSGKKNEEEKSSTDPRWEILKKIIPADRDKK
ncbi:MAG: DUF177 domain-containing protein [Bacteroidetes bacterium]|nr:DUF177 domain-containing protein [Bacteroidota bacterium]